MSISRVARARFEQQHCTTGTRAVSLCTRHTSNTHASRVTCSQSRRRRSVPFARVSALCALAAKTTNKTDRQYSPSMDHNSASKALTASTGEDAISFCVSSHTLLPLLAARPPALTIRLEVFRVTRALRPGCCTVAVDHARSVSHRLAIVVFLEPLV